MRFEDPILVAVSDLHARLNERGECLAIAESCTGGLLGGAVTAIDGASSVFVYDLVTYSNSAKTELLAVSPETIQKTGAVSGPTARAMATGVRNRLKSADWGLSITGLAGPSGGRPGKPVGTVYIGIASIGEGDGWSMARHFRFDGDRSSIRHQTIRAALELALSVIGHASVGANRPS